RYRGGRKLEARTLGNGSLNLPEFCKSQASYDGGQHDQHQNHSLRHTLSKSGTKQLGVVWTTVKRKLRLSGIDFTNRRKDSEIRPVVWVYRITSERLLRAGQVRQLQSLFLLLFIAF